MNSFTTITIGIFSLIIGIVIWFLRRKGIIKSGTITTLSEIATIVTAITAIILFMFPLDSEPDQPFEPTQTPNITETPIPTKTMPSTNAHNLEPSVTPIPSYYFLSLNSISTDDEKLPDLNLPIGLNHLVGVTFNVNQKANTQCDYIKDGNRELELNVNLSETTAVHFLMSGTTVQKSFSGKEVGIITLNFSNGQSYSEQLIAGKNIRNWALNRSELDINYLDDSNVQEAWQYTIYLPLEDKYVIGVWDRLTIPVPEHLTNTVLENVKIVDTSHETLNNLNPCIYIVAVTIEYNTDQ